MKSRAREVELGSLIAGWVVLLLSCSSTVAFRTLFVTLFRASVETAISEVSRLLRTGGVPTSLTLTVLVVAYGLSVFTGRSAGMSIGTAPPSPSTPHPIPPSLASRMRLLWK